jgi:hypothetical protein
VFYWVNITCMQLLQSKQCSDRHMVETGLSYKDMFYGGAIDYFFLIVIAAENLRGNSWNVCSVSLHHCIAFVVNRHKSASISKENCLDPYMCAAFGNLSYFFESFWFSW